MQKEVTVFNKLKKLCTSEGYAHVIAYFCFISNWIAFDTITPEAMLDARTRSSLLRSEIALLINLMLSQELNLTLPHPDKLQEMIDQTEQLLKEMHGCLLKPLLLNFEPIISGSDENKDYMGGTACREAIFYGGESAYPFQYINFAIKKYSQDNLWLEKNKGFRIEQAGAVIKAISDIQSQKMLSYTKSMTNMHPDEYTFLKPMIFSAEEIKQQSGLSVEAVNNILEAFCYENSNNLLSFEKIDDYNPVKSHPLIKFDGSKYLLFQQTDMAQALYETPFHWMLGDDNYKDDLAKNIGAFTEALSEERLISVFGANNVLKNISVVDPSKTKGNKTIWEIDVLVTYADRVIILQTKSKRLTLLARQGDDTKLKDDFEKAIQHAYNQGLGCAKSYLNGNYKLVDSAGREVKPLKKIKEVYIFCITSEHYPALFYQSKSFIKVEEIALISHPFVMDIFFLDVLTDLLSSPILFLSYIKRRVNYHHKLIAYDELTVFSYHLKYNLWINEDINIFALDEDCKANVDACFPVRRASLPGKFVPDGLLTCFENKILADFMRQLNDMATSESIDVAEAILSLDCPSLLKFTDEFNAMSTPSPVQQLRNLSILSASQDVGVTIHYNNHEQIVANMHLFSNCEIKKYQTKASCWFGVCINNENGKIRFIIKLNYPWAISSELDKKSEDFKKFQIDTRKKYFSKVSRNQPCPCGSGKKSKKCCV